MNQLIKTYDGSHTIFVPELNEHYHSIHGAVQESKHIFINYGYNFCEADPVNIFEVGFGTGLNALLTAIECYGKSRIVNYTSIEKYPIDEELIRQLNYKELFGKNGLELFQKIHLSKWNMTEKITQNFNLLKLKSDLTNSEISGNYDLVYFDAFGPDKQPEMWSREVFNMMSSIMVKGGILVTYSAKGEVKRNLKSSGFEVKFLPGPPGKREIIRAVKN